jgi:uncharacterized protein YbjT (DUF2867 family)
VEDIKLILVTGASGKTGKAVINKLVSADLPVRAMVRSENRVNELKKLGCVEVVIADMLDPKTVNDAFRGVQQVYHICPNMSPDEVKIGRIMIDAATHNDLKQFVYHSVLHPQVETMAHHWQKLRVEEQLMKSALPFTILQPAAYMQNLFGYWEKMMNEGIYAIPYSVDSRSSMIDLQDLAEIVFKIMTESGHAFGVYELCGCQALSARQISEIVSKKTGKSVKAVSLDREQWEKNMRFRKMPEYAINTLLNMFVYYEDYDFIGNCNQLSWLLGRKPVTFETFIEKQIQSYDFSENDLNG